jgi:hypothetical protein
MTHEQLQVYAKKIHTTGMTRFASAPVDSASHYQKALTRNHNGIPLVVVTTEKSRAILGQFPEHELQVTLRPQPTQLFPDKDGIISIPTFNIGVSHLIEGNNGVRDYDIWGTLVDEKYSIYTGDKEPVYELVKTLHESEILKLSVAKWQQFLSANQTPPSILFEDFMLDQVTNVLREGSFDFITPYDLRLDDRNYVELL